jgi:hypothetical protein
MRWRELIPRKDPRARVVLEAWLLEPGGGLALMDDPTAAVEATAAIMKTAGRLHRHV